MSAERFSMRSLVPHSCMTQSPPAMSSRVASGFAVLAPLGRALEATPLPPLPGLGRNASVLAYAWFLWGLGAGLWAYTWPVYLASLGAESRPARVDAARREVEREGLHGGAGDGVAHEAGSWRSDGEARIVTGDRGSRQRAGVCAARAAWQKATSKPGPVSASSKRSTTTGVVLDGRASPNPSAYSTRKPSIVITSFAPSNFAVWRSLSINA